MTCKHCGKPIRQTNWYDGPGWTHDDSRYGRFCPPTTAATPRDEDDD